MCVVIVSAAVAMVCGLCGVLEERGIPFPVVVIKFEVVPLQNLERVHLGCVLRPTVHGRNNLIWMQLNSVSKYLDSKYSLLCPYLMQYH